MPRYRRAYVPGGTYFFTVVTEGRRPILTNTDVRLALRDAINTVRENMPFQIDGWVLMPDHMHTIWTLPPGDADFPGRWRRIKAHVTRQCGGRYRQPDRMTDRRAGKGHGTLWQHRYWEHLIRDEKDLRHHLDYVHANALKHGLVQHVADWPWSTFHRYVRDGTYSADWDGTEQLLDDRCE